MAVPEDPSGHGELEASSCSGRWGAAMLGIENAGSEDLMGGDGRGPRGMFGRFFHSQVASTGVLAAAAVAAVVWANSPWADAYFELASTRIGFAFGSVAVSHSLAHWIKDGLMAVFFFVVGLEIKREIVVGELSSFKKALLPVTAAVAGALVPAMIYAAFNAGGPASAGWGVPMATDIAFALGVLALFGDRVPLGLKVFLTALAIADDLLAVVVIAVFYTNDLDLAALGLGLGLLAVMWLLGRLRLRILLVYVAIAVGVWFCFEASGVHATIAGVLVALLIPVRSRTEPSKLLARARAALDALERAAPTRESLNVDAAQRDAAREVSLAAYDVIPPGVRLEHQLHGFQAFVILPLFALFAAGVRFEVGLVEAMTTPVALGILLGLLLGKQAGIVAGSWLAVRLGGGLPEGVRWVHLWGASILGAIGFTMSVFIAELAFTDPGLIAQAKVAILVTSLIAGAFGAVVLWRTLPRVERHTS